MGDENMRGAPLRQSISQSSSIEKGIDLVERLMISPPYLLDLLPYFTLQTS